MIQQIHLEPHPKPEISGKDKITMPGLGIDVKRALQQYAMGTMEERAKGFYEQQGLPIPDFDRMSKIERLVALNDTRELAKAQRENLININARATAAKEEAILQKTVKQKVDEAIKSERNSRSGEGTSKS